MKIFKRNSLGATIFNKHMAFTLAEVLITLGIIGVVAAMTIPTLMNKTNDAEMKTGLKKAYSVLSQATQQVATDNGGDWPATDPALGDLGKAVYDLIAPKLSYSKSCTGVASTGDMPGGCWYGVSSLDSQSTNILVGLDGNPVTHLAVTGGLVLNDGMLFGLAYLDDGIATIYNFNACDSTSGTVNNICSAFIVDVNGNKKPNIVGKDVYLFYVKKDGVLKPFGNTDDGHENTCVATNTGVGCAAKYLYNK